MIRCVVIGLRNVSRPDSAARASPAAGRQDVIAAGRVVAGRHRRPRPHEDGARVADTAGERLGVAEQDEVLGGDRLGLRERPVEVAVGLDQPADGVAPVFALSRQLQVDHAPIRVRAGQHDDLGRAGRQVDRDVARDDQLGLVHGRAPRAYDLRDPPDVCEPADGLRAADRPHVVESQQARRSRDRARPAGRSGDDDPLHAGLERGHRAHHERRDEPARHVDTDRLDCDPAPLELDAGGGFHAHVGGPLGRVPAPDRMREGEDSLVGRRRGLGPCGLGAVEAEGPLANGLVPAGLDVGNDLGSGAQRRSPSPGDTAAPALVPGHPPPL